MKVFRSTCSIEIGRMGAGLMYSVGLWVEATCCVRWVGGTCMYWGVVYARTGDTSLRLKFSYIPRGLFSMPELSIHVVIPVYFFFFCRV